MKKWHSRNVEDMDTTNDVRLPLVVYSYSRSLLSPDYTSALPSSWGGSSSAFAEVPG